MKILAIHIKNLASLEGTYMIDFTREPLASAGIFAITGPTGAGKSTILDALCLALYGKTPRFAGAESANIIDVSGDEISQGDARGILRDGTAEGYAKVDFVSTGGKAYQAAWQVRRARNRPDGKLQPPEMTLKDLQSQQYFAGKKTETLKAIEDKVGLSFDQFTRSVLLAQGDFTAFMKAGNHEKAALLEKLTGTAIYSKISMTVNARYKEERQSLEMLHKEIGFITVLENDALKKLLEEKKRLQVLSLRDEQAISRSEQSLNRKKNLLLMEQNLAVARQNHEAAKQESEKARERRALWRQIERVQPARPVVEKVDELYCMLDDEEKSQESFRVNLEQLTTQRKAIDTACTAAEQQLQAAVARQEESVPKQNQARVLELQIKERESFLGGISSDLSRKQVELATLRDNSRFAVQQLDRLVNELKANGEWMDTHAARRPVAEQMLQISERLEGAAGVLLQVKECRRQISALSEKLRLETAEKYRQLQTKDDVSRQISRLGKLLEERQSALAEMPFNDWEAAQKQYATKVLELSDAKLMWQRLFTFLTEKEEWRIKTSELEKKLISEQDALAKAESELAYSRAVLKTRKESLEAVRLAAADSVEAMRANLRDGEPCPVCGSKEHPYISEYPHFEKVLTQLEQDFEKAAAQHEHWLTERAALKQSCHTLDHDIAQAHDFLSGNEPLLQNVLEKWQRLPLHDEAEQITAERRMGWFDEQIKTAKAENEMFQANISRYNALKARSDEQKQVLEEQRQQLLRLEKNIAVAESGLRSLNEQIDRIKAEEQTGFERLRQVKESLDGCFPEETWWINWQEDPAGFLQKTQKFSKQWTEKKEQIAQQNHEKALLEQESEYLQKRLKALGSEYQEQLKIYQEHQLVLEKIKSDRQLIFNGQAVEEVVIHLKNAVRIAESDLKTRSAERERLAHQVTEISTQLAVSGQRIATLKQQIKTKKDELSEWLAGVNRKFQDNLSMERLSELLAYSATWMAQEDRYFKTLQESLTRSMTQLEEREKDMAKALREDMPEEDIEALAARLAALKEQLDAKKSRQNEIDYQLRSDQQSRERLDDIQAKVEAREKTVAGWGKLQELIGSADGKKFRDIAQEYTLEVMLTYANVHLESLNKRYELQRIPGTLALQVIDHDMGDELRTVLSLSGGESFMTSLALALGLASLSSSQMTVESLFIDEGFGSLDPDALNIVMDALERLQHQGRKVGVISHVAEMTERIPVQIQVAKQHGGKSKLTVVQV